MQLFLVTSGIDPICDPPEGNLLKDRAKDLDKNVELLIISIGEQDRKTQQIFENYAQAFNGFYLPVQKPEFLPPIVESVSRYGYGYGYPFTPMPNPTNIP